jgi:hypothetical protein
VAVCQNGGLFDGAEANFYLPPMALGPRPELGSPAIQQDQKSAAESRAQTERLPHQN